MHTPHDAFDTHKHTMSHRALFSGFSAMIARDAEFEALVDAKYQEFLEWERIRYPTPTTPFQCVLCDETVEACACCDDDIIPASG